MNGSGSDADSGIHRRARRSRPLGLLGKYRLLELIGSGAMGDVYRAEHVLLGRVVAVKVLHAELAGDKTLVERFFAEARAVNLVGHPHIVEVTDFAREPDGTVWFVMEFLEGSDLANLLRGSRLPLPRAIAIAQQICAALDAVHAVGIIHRDIKPENIYITERDGQDFVKLLDFGIARLPEPVAHEPGGTGRGVVMGTPPYMAPEQACALDVDHRSDIYAVGAVLFELITGSMLFKRTSIHQLLEDVAFTPAPAPSSLVPLPDSVRDAIDAVLARCLAKDPAQRPTSAAALGDELGAIAAQLDPRAAQASADARRNALAAAAEPGKAPVLALVPSADAIVDQIEAVAVLDSCRPRWPQRALWVAAAVLLLSGGARLAPRVYPQLNSGITAGLADVARAAGGSQDAQPTTAQLAASARAMATAPHVVMPAPQVTPPPHVVTPAAVAGAGGDPTHVSTALVAPVAHAVDVPRAPTAEEADQARERSRARAARRAARAAQSEAVAASAPQPSLAPPVLTIAAAANEPLPEPTRDLDPDKLLDPFAR